MSLISEKIKQINTAEVILSEGVSLRRRGQNHVGLCCFHADKSPSLVVYPDGHWWCFSCQIGGDAVDFIQRLKGCSFIEACRYLGIKTGRPSADDRHRIRELKRKREKQKLQKQRESDLCFTLGTLIRWTLKAMVGFTPETFDQYGEIIQDLPSWEYAHDTLIHGTTDEKLKVIKAFQDFQIIERNRLFDKNFDFEKWLRKFQHNGEPYVKNFFC